MSSRDDSSESTTLDIIIPTDSEGNPLSWDGNPAKILGLINEANLHYERNGLFAELIANRAVVLNNGKTASLLICPSFAFVNIPVDVKTTSYQKPTSPHHNGPPALAHPWAPISAGNVSPRSLKPLAALPLSLVWGRGLQPSARFGWGLLGPKCLTATLFTDGGYEKTVNGRVMRVNPKYTYVDARSDRVCFLDSHTREVSMRSSAAWARPVSPDTTNAPWLAATH